MSNALSTFEQWRREDINPSDTTTIRHLIAGIEEIHREIMMLIDSLPMDDQLMLELLSDSERCTFALVDLEYLLRNKLQEITDDWDPQDNTTF